MTTSEVAKQQSIGEYLVSKRVQLMSLLPATVTPERMLRLTLNSIAKTPGLQKCTQQSILACIFQAAAVGLEIDNGLGWAYMVPYEDKRNNRTVAQFQIGYKGLCQLMYRSNQVQSIQARVVRKGDLFDWEMGLVEKLSHRATGPEDGPVTHAYAIVRLKEGDPEHPLFEVMTRKQVDAIRKRSRAGNNGPWVSDYDQMAQKTALRRLSKVAPMSAQDLRVITADELVDANVDPMTAFDPELLQLAEEAPELLTQPESDPSGA